ncbi:DODA-type extradiol aromatic ring-opening family dioxygenase [Thiolinea disciformis]|uniref:DODA-type extradiol aromatic ring-opening family dioxygenase n=1 Tax=Thiolinea disciformis TaxID=125614 RepID=UPI000373BCC1|nr:class III extradiol ring-cleavage dioxygenase [Thiolinea disciformis]
MQRLPTYFLSHGGGPWPYMKAEMGTTYDALEKSLKAIPQQLGARPKAVLVVTAHWETDTLKLSASANPPMVYDYYGFPDYTYHVVYPAPGEPALALEVQGLLKTAGFEVELDAERGFDHGTFSLMYPLYPEADIPVVQLSIQQNYDPDFHLKMGRALAPLREQGVLIIGSGLSYHNLRQFNRNAEQPSRQFDDWLQETLLHTAPEQRTKRLLHWQEAPAARLAHPREDHLVPLMVAVGAAEHDKGQCVYYQNDFFGGITVSSFRFG